MKLKFLELIQYNTHIKFSTYTKYYLELKSVEPDFPLKPMDIFTKQKLENQSKAMEENLKKKMLKLQRMLKKLDKTPFML